VVRVHIPADIWSINWSFFGGLFGDSVRTLGRHGFKEKDQFDCDPSLLYLIDHRNVSKAIIGHHTTAEQAGTVFCPGEAEARRAPIVPGDASALVPQTRKTYSGPLEVGEDSTSLEIGEKLIVHRPTNLEPLISQYPSLGKFMRTTHAATARLHVYIKYRIVAELNLTQNHALVTDSSTKPDHDADSGDP
jgi:hypothetical protein